MTARRLVLATVLLVLGGACEGFRRDQVPHNAHELARNESVQIQQAVEMYRLRTDGACPEGQVVLQATGILDQVRTDPWGNGYVITCPGEKQNVDVVSAGPDGVLGSKDDIASWDELAWQ